MRSITSGWYRLGWQLRASLCVDVSAHLPTEHLEHLGSRPALRGLDGACAAARSEHTRTRHHEPVMNSAPRGTRSQGHAVCCHRRSNHSLVSQAQAAPWPIAPLTRAAP